METLNSIISSANDFIWTYIVIGLLCLAGLYFTIRTRFVQLSLGEMFHLLGDSNAKSSKGKNISSFQAFCVSLASHVGVGNLSGVAIAIAVGGPAAVFWMWAIAVIGAASSFAECTLAQVYKQKSKDSFIGGPAYYMLYGVGRRWMGVLFAVLISITFGFAYNSVQSNTVSSALEHSFGFEPWVVGMILAIITLTVIFGGIHRIARISSLIVPVMALLYIAVAVYIVASNITMFPDVISEIFSGAFGAEQFAGGALGAGVMQGIRRGLFSNEAGEGSTPNAAATAIVSHPVKQGLIQALGVFTDTLLICSCTAFIILVADVPLDGSVTGIQLTQIAIDKYMGGVGHIFITLCILMFAFSSIIGNYYYGEANIKFISSRPVYLTIYRVAVGAMVFLGSILTLDLAWGLADITMALMTTVNLAAILILSRIVFVVLKDYRKQKKNGVKDPTFSTRTLTDAGINTRGIHWDEIEK
ncbi:MAG: alanine:cation symporter family protein [Flavobacteriales bacterium]|nr:alanine:cation symporter family protein [Flavobacteriales bacterium]